MNVVMVGSEGFIGRELRRQCVVEGISVAGIDRMSLPGQASTPDAAGWHGAQTGEDPVRDFRRKSGP